MEFDWNAVVEDLGPRLYRYFHARFSREESADLTQDTLIRLVRRLREGGYHSDRGSLRMYAFGIAHYVAMDALKVSFKSEALAAEEELIAVSPVEENIIGRQESQAVRHALTKLPLVQREILMLLIDEEMSLAEISLLLKIPVGTLKSHIFRAKARLRELLLQEGKVHERPRTK